MEACSRIGNGNIKECYSLVYTIYATRTGVLCPVFIPNYYRGAYRQFPRVAGRSSHLFNTGTAAWVYRCIIAGLFGLKGSRDGLMIQPQLPEKWESASVKRYFRGATFKSDFVRENSVSKTEVFVDGRYIEDGIVRDIKEKSEYNVLVKLPVK